MKSYFFNAEPTTDLTAHPTGYDREYDADDHAAFFAPFFTEAGVFAGQNADACKVTVLEGTTLQVAAGHVYARGRMAEFDGTETVTVSENCTIVARMNKGAEVRAFQLLAVTELADTEDVLDVPLAAATLSPVSGGYEVTLEDKRTFMAFTGQPPYYPPDSETLPYILWLYTLGYPMTEEQRQAVEGNPDLMALFHASLGAGKKAAVTFSASSWVSGEEGYTLTIPRASHGRQSGDFGFSLWQQVSGTYVRGTWADVCTDVSYDAATGNIVLSCETGYDGKIVFYA